jgi:glutamate dehydrogenase/leucine dehydrogenase
MQAVFDLIDALGPEKVVHVHDPASGLRAIVVVDNTACGPAIGGARMAEDVTLQECARLARAMTLKNAAARLPHGGAKSVIVGNPKLPAAQKEPLLRAFARAIGELESYIVGPDMGTDETCMAWIRDEIGRAVGLPPEVGGIPLDEIGATGFGLFAAIDVAKDRCGVRLDSARVAVQGFGAVGLHAARFLAERGARLVAAADSKGTISDPNGLDLARLVALKKEGRSVVELESGTRGDRDAILDVECEIWIPAARPDVIRADNVGRLRTKLVAQGANIPATPEAEASLHARGVLVLPDFIANAGGVICAAVEYQGGTQSTAFATIDERIRDNTRAVLDRTTREATPRQAAVALAGERVRRAMRYRRR